MRVVALVCALSVACGNDQPSSTSTASSFKKASVAEHGLGLTVEQTSATTVRVSLLNQRERGISTPHRGPFLLLIDGCPTWEMMPAGFIDPPIGTPSQPSGELIAPGDGWARSLELGDLFEDADPKRGAQASGSTSRRSVESAKLAVRVWVIPEESFIRVTPSQLAEPDVFFGPVPAGPKPWGHPLRRHFEHEGPGTYRELLIEPGHEAVRIHFVEAELTLADTITIRAFE